MKDTLIFYKINLARLKELALDCPGCIQDRVLCHHYDYLRRYIEELEGLPPFDEEKFDHFWKEYPCKKSKKYTRQVWEKLGIGDELFEIIMRAVQEQKKSDQWTKDKGRFIPHPASWLNGERWDDEVELLGNKENDKYNNI
ncbi:MAG: hypothetical protein WD898_02380 [Candidatus Paceibacterota bacterium]